MGKHLKTEVIERLAGTVATFVRLPKGSTPKKRGVYYFHECLDADALWGAMDTEKEGQKYRKRIVVRPSRFREGLYELYTYHFPKRWSAACTANRELIKEAQRRAHALERDHGREGIEWRIRFFDHYFRVFKGGEKPAEGMKAYSRFYQYVYVAIYRELRERAKGEEMKGERVKIEGITVEGVSGENTEEMTFEAVGPHPIFRGFSSPWRRAYNYFSEHNLQPPDIQRFIIYEKSPRTTAKFGHVEEKQ